MDTLTTEAVPIWANQANSAYNHPLTEWVPYGNLDSVRVTAELRSRTGNIEFQPFVQLADGPTTPAPGAPSPSSAPPSPPTASSPAPPSRPSPPPSATAATASRPTTAAAPTSTCATLSFESTNGRAERANMAAFPGTLQSPFVVATDRAIGRSQVVSLTAIEVAVSMPKGRNGIIFPDSDGPKFANLMAQRQPSPMAECATRTVDDGERAWCERTCKDEGYECCVACNWRWRAIVGCVLQPICSTGENCRWLSPPQVETPQ